MSPAIIALIIVAIVAIVVLGLLLMRPQLHSQRLRRRFGPEYDRAVEEHQSRGEAERELLTRERRFKELNIRPLEPAVRDRYRTEWTAIQERFVDDPRGAAAEADRLITSIMSEQGYPDEGYERRIADLSVGHPRAVHHYRQAHEMGSRASQDGASTEDLRQAVMHYRAIFDELLDTRKATPGTRDTAEHAEAEHIEAEHAEAEHAEHTEREAEPAEAKHAERTERAEPVVERVEDGRHTDKTHSDKSAGRKR